jgi:hypothetical protein
MRRIVLFAAAMLAGASSSASAGEGPIGTSGGPDIRFRGCMYYQHANFGGGSASIAGGIRRRLGSAWNDEISSVACHPYCRLTVYEHREFGGARRVFRGNISFVGEAWNDEISSMEASCE